MKTLLSLSLVFFIFNTFAAGEPIQRNIITTNATPPAATNTSPGLLSHQQFNVFQGQRNGPYQHSMPPVRGYNTWYEFSTGLHQTNVLRIIELMKTNGMLEAGFDYILLDDSVFWDRAPVTFVPLADTNRFPMGFPALANAIHTNGFKVGIYTGASVGTGPAIPPVAFMFGSLGFEEIDANYFLTNHVDYIKYEIADNPFNASSQSVFPLAYSFPVNGVAVGFTNLPGYGASMQSLARFSSWMRLADYPVHINCGTAGYISGMNRLANSWRFPGVTGTNGFAGDIHGVNWFQILCAWMDEAVKWQQTAAPWSYVDFDAMAIQGTVDQWRGRLSVHAMWSSSLQMGVLNATAHSIYLPSLTNRNMLAIQNDPGLQPARFTGVTTNGLYTYAKYLVGPGGQEQAIMIQNRNTNAAAATATVYWLTNAGFPLDRYVTVWDVWENTNQTIQVAASGFISTTVGPASAKLFRVTPVQTLYAGPGTDGNSAYRTMSLGVRNSLMSSMVPLSNGEVNLTTYLLKLQPFQGLVNGLTYTWNGNESGGQLGAATLDLNGQLTTRGTNTFNGVATNVVSTTEIGEIPITISNLTYYIRIRR